MKLWELIDNITIQGMVHLKLISFDGDVVDLKTYYDFEYENHEEYDSLYVKYIYNACDCLQIELTETKWGI